MYHCIICSTSKKVAYIRACLSTSVQKKKKKNMVLHGALSLGLSVQVLWLSLQLQNGSVLTRT